MGWNPKNEIPSRVWQGKYKHGSTAKGYGAATHGCDCDDCTEALASDLAAEERFNSIIGFDMELNMRSRVLEFLTRIDKADLLDRYDEIYGKPSENPGLNAWIQFKEGTS